MVCAFGGLDYSRLVMIDGPMQSALDELRARVIMRIAAIRGRNVTLETIRVKLADRTDAELLAEIVSANPGASSRVNRFLRFFGIARAPR